MRNFKFLKLLPCLFIFLFVFNLSGSWFLASVKNVFTSKKEDRVEFEYDSKENLTLKIDSLDGNVFIKPTTGKLKIIATMRGAEDALEKNKVERAQEVTTIFVRTTEDDAAYPVLVDYEVFVPQNVTKIKILGRKSQVEVENVPSSLEVEIAFGKIHINNSSKYTNVKVHRGTIVANHPTSAIDAFTEVGRIYIKNATGDVTAKSSKGNIYISKEKLSKDGLIMIDSSRGYVILELPEKGKAQLSAKTSSGTLTSEIPITLEPKTTTLDSIAWDNFTKEASGVIGNCRDGCETISIDVKRGNIRITKIAK